jgi:glycosyltransferase involved in cell wall biosynthesis
VLFLLPSLGGGGAERVMVSLAARLNRERFEPHLAVLEKTGPLVSAVPRDVPLHELGSRRVRYALPGLVPLVRALKPAAVLSNIAELNLLLILARPLLPRGVRLLVRETILVSAWLGQDANHAGVLSLGYRLLYPRADAVICQCEAMARDLQERFRVPPEKIARIYNPVDFERLRALSEAASDPYVPFGAGPHLVASGRLTGMKGFDLLLEAMALIGSEFPDAELTILGTGPLEDELKVLSRTLDLQARVRFQGFQLNPYPWVKHADVFVLSSRYEGLPNAMLEALALGTPVVGTDCPGGVREILEGNPLGRVAEGVDSGRLAEAITEALRAGRPPHVEPPDEEFVERFRLDRIVDQYEKVLAGP